MLHLLNQYKEQSIDDNKFKNTLAKFLNKDYDLSNGQLGLWALCKEKNDYSYNIPIALHISNYINMEMLQKAIYLLMIEYPILNSYIYTEKNGLPKRKIKKSFYPYIEEEDMSMHSTEECLEYVNYLSTKSISVENENLTRFFLLKKSKNEYYLLINIHHIIFDGSSIFILIDKLLNNYVDILEGNSVKVNKYSTDFNEYVEMEKEKESSKEYEIKSEFWSNILEGYSAPLDIDYPETQIESNIKTKKIKIDKKTKDKVTNFCKNNKINQSVFFYSLYKVYLQSCNKNNLIVGMPTIQRPTQNFKNSIGYFVNMVPLRQEVKPEITFNNHLQKSKQVINRGIVNSDYPFRLINRNFNMNNNQHIDLINTSFSYQNYIKKNEFEKYKHFRDKLSVEVLKDIHQKGEYSLILEVFDVENSFEIRLKYDENIIEERVFGEFTKNFYKLIVNVLDSEGETEVGDLMKELNDDNNNVIQLLNDSFRKYRDEVAIEDYKSSLTYGQLKEEVNKVKFTLISKGIKPGDFVGILVDRNISIASAIISILSMNAVFIPIDSRLPLERIRYIIKDSGVKGIIVDENTNDIGLDLKSDIEIININNLSKNYNSGLRNKYPLNEESLAYLIYTSGSTGKPKGVKIIHSALTNLLLSMKKRPGFSKSDVLLSTTSYGFDIFMLELLLPLIAGGKCIIVSEEIKRDPEQLKNYINQMNPTVMQGTPSMWSVLLKVGWKNQNDMKILCGGEALPENLKQRLLQNSSDVWNMYGPTETTIWSSVKKLNEQPISIGTPINNTKLFVLEGDMSSVNKGEKGELYIGGVGLAQGYHNKLSLTEEKFVNSPYGEGKLFKTGDSAQLTESNEIVILGRIDNQIKLNGQRIELEEIENVISDFDQIEKCIVYLKEHENNKKLVCCYTSNDEFLSVDNIKKYLFHIIPEYMIPKEYIKLDEFPVNSSNKIDRKLTKEITMNSENKNTKKEKGKESSEIKIKDIIKSILSIPSVDNNTGFFELGIDSIYSIELVELINKEFDVNITTTDIFSYPNIASLAEYIDSKSHNNILNDKKSIIDLNEQNNLNKEDVAIIGISCMVPGAENHNDFWSNLVDGIESIEKVPTSEQPKNINDNYIPKKFSIKDKSFFDPKFFKISPKQAENMDPQTRLLLTHSWKAIEDAGYNYEDISNTSVFISLSNNSYNSEQNNGFIDSSNTYTNWLLKQPGTTATTISYYLNLTGLSIAVHSNCSSSLVGVDLAVDNIKSGKSTYALVGAATIHSLLNKGYVYSKGLNFSSNGHVSPFDEKADGMIGGEGVGVILIKNARQAISDRDNIYAIIKKTATNNDGKDKAGFYAPSIKGQSDVLKNSIGNKFNNIDFIETHGTGTQIGDPIEIESLKNVLTNSSTNSCALSSVKANIGHLDTLSGLIGVIKSCLIIKNRLLPPMINFNKLNYKIDLDDTPFYINKSLHYFNDKNTRILGGVSSFGIGGTNSHVVLEEYIDNNKTESLEGKNYIIPLSAKDIPALRRYARDLKNRLKITQSNIQDISSTFQSGRHQMNTRIVFIVRNTDELINQIENFLESNEDDSNNYIPHITDENELRAIQKWKSGDNVCWSDYVNNRNSKKISLPTYPFDLKEYKIETKNESESLKVLHPFVHRNISNLYSYKYITNVKGNNNFVYDHIINNKMIIPGVYFIEAMKYAVESFCNHKVQSINNIIWKKPIEVGKEKDIFININTEKQKNKIIVNVSESNNNDTPSNSQAMINFQPLNDDLTVRNISKIKNHSKYTLSHSQIYNIKDSSVYNYGETYKAINKMYVLENEVLSDLKIPNICSGTFSDFCLHPTLMEGALQSISPLLQKNNAPFMPYSIKQIKIHGNMEKNMYAYVEKIAPKHSRVETFNIDLCNSKGEVIVQIINYVVGYFDLNNEKNINYYNKNLESQKLLHKRLNIEKVENISFNGKYHFDNVSNLYFIDELKDIEEGLNKNNYFVVHLPDEVSNYEKFMRKMFSFIKKLSAFDRKNNINIIFVYSISTKNIYYESLSAFLKSLNMEFSTIKSKVVSYSSDILNLDKKIINEFYDFSAPSVYLENEKRLVEKLQPITDIDNLKFFSRIKQNGVYVIFGGNGKLGRKLTDYLINNYNCQIIILSRKKPKDFSKSYNESNITYINCDVSDLASVKLSMNSIEEKFKNINGIFHCSGILEDSLIKDKTFSSFYDVIDPKINGVINIDAVTKKLKLDFIVLFSSISSLGNRGQSDYSFANEFLNKFSKYRNLLKDRKLRYGTTLSIGWPIWEEGNMKPPDYFTEFLKNSTGNEPLETKTGFLAMENLLKQHDLSSAFVFYGVTNKINEFLQKY